MSHISALSTLPRDARDTLFLLAVVAVLMMRPRSRPPEQAAPDARAPRTLVLTGATGTLSLFTGPTGPTYTIVDGAAAYGNIAIGASASCAATGSI